MKTLKNLSCDTEKMSEIQAKLFELQDLKYKVFHSKLIPNIDKNSIIGVRVPVVRDFANELIKNNNSEKFLLELPHMYYDENILHSIIISKIKDYNKLIIELNKFLPYIDNWAVCDIISILKTKSILDNMDNLLNNIKKWAKSKHVYTARFALCCLMKHFLGDRFKREFLEIPINIKIDDYYIKMMKAWFFAEALVKQYDYAIVYIEDKKLDSWTHKKTIQKAIESYRITLEIKNYLKTLR